MKRAIQITLVFFLSFWIPPSVWAQKNPDFKQQFLGKSGRDIVKHCIQNKKGEYVMVGSTASWLLSNDDDIFFTKVDANTLNPLINAVPIGDKHKDMANSIVQTRDGGYVIAGYTDSVKFGKREAWLVKVSETGLRLWDTKIGTPQDDEFTAVAEAPNGDLWMTGASNDKLWVVKTDALGTHEKQFTDFAPNKTLTRLYGNALTWDKNGRYLTIVGVQIMQNSETKENQSDLLFARFDTEGENFSDENRVTKAEGKSIVCDKTGHFGIIGTSFEHEKTGNSGIFERDKGDILFLYTDAKGDVLTTKRFGKANTKEMGLGIAEDWDGNFILVGEFYEQSRINTTQGWMHKIRKDGSDVWDKPRSFGASGDDAFNAVLSSDKGAIIATGKRYKGLASDGWVVAIDSKTPLQNRGKIDLDVTGGRFHDDEDVAFLRKDKRGFYDFWIENRDTGDVFGLVAKVVQTKNKKNATNSFYDRIVIGTLRGKERRLVTIPFQGSANLPRDEWDFDVKFLALKDTLDMRHAFHISTRDELKYKLDTAHTFPSDIRAGQTVSFSFSLKNTGDLAAQNVQLKIDIPTGTRIKMASKSSVDLENIGVGETRTGNFVFEVEKEFVAEVLLLPIYAVVNGSKRGVEYQLITRVHPDTTRRVVAAPVAVVTTQPTVTAPQIIKPPLRLIWQNGRDTAIATKPSYPVQLIVETDKELNRKEHFKVLFNGRENTGEKFDNVRLTEAKASGPYRHRYLLMLDPSLPIGKMEIKVIVNDGNAPKQTQFVINRVNPPNLYLLTVGVDYSGNKKGLTVLSYTAADATSIDSVFKTQKGKAKIFEKVVPISLTNEFQTRGRYIKEQLKTLANECKESDVFIVLLSGHGGIPNDKSESIRFLGSDYDPSVPDTYLDYKTDIKAILDKTKGQKILFLDACQKRLDKSATAADPQQLSEAIERVIRATPTFRALLSCSREQSSWELNTYGHGAFTQALLEAFRNQTVSCGDNEEDCNANIDPNDVSVVNRFLTFQELARFVKKRVSTIVKEIGQKQNPTERDDYPEEDIPIFWFDK